MHRTWDTSENDRHHYRSDESIHHSRRRRTFPYRAAECKRILLRGDPDTEIFGRTSAFIYRRWDENTVLQLAAADAVDGLTLWS